MRRVRGFIDLVFDVVEETTNLVERTHDAVVERSARRFAPIEPATSTAKVITGVETAISGGVFESIRVLNGFSRFTVNAVADVAEAGLDQPTDAEELQLATPIKSTAAGTASWYVDYLQASINGFWGDHLSRKKSAAAFPNPTNKVCVFVHSLAATEWLWSLSSEEHYGDPDVTFGTRLADDLGFTPIYLRYNTGRHISENGRALAKLIAEVLDAYPVPVEEIALVGHSMGGLVVRSAAHYAREHDEPWVAHLRHVACIGSPHLGAPLEKAVNVLTNVLRKVDAAGAHVPAELLDSRSAGIKDLRYGYTIDEEWAGRDPDEVFADARRHVPLVDGVGYYFLAATIARDPAHPLGQLLGDLMVRLPSASGEAPEHARRIHFSGGAVFPGMNHIHIANHPDVYEALRDLLAA
ncbi:MAG: alpha/beta fold hydrolase [Deltaproteobacteria bacterium]|nr:alpha/beta fold hydrolase [Deltaproteobacteria bacterium]